MEKKKIGKLGQVLIWLYIPVALVCLALAGWLMYYYMFLKDNVVIQTNFVDSASYSEDETFFIDINSYTNEKNNGEKVIEIKFNYYIDSDLPQKDEDGKYQSKYIYSSGVQFHEDKKYDIPHVMSSAPAYGAWSSIKEYKINNCVYYDKDAGDEGFESMTTLTEQKQWIWDVKGKLCLLQVKGPTVVKYGTWGWKHYIRYNTSALIARLYEISDSLPNGEHIKMLNFSEFFHIMLQDENGIFKNEIVDENVLKEWTFVNVRVNKSQNGMISSTQSLFNSYKGDTEWTFDGSENNQLYWADETIYDLTIKDFKYTTADNGYNIELKKSCVDFLQEFSNMVVNVEINFEDINPDLNVIGFTEKPFGNLKVNKIELNSPTHRDFIIFNIYDYQISTQNVTVIEGGGA